MHGLDYQPEAEASPQPLKFNLACFFTPVDTKPLQSTTSVEVLANLSECSVLHA
jgi:hypothetical protein